MYKVYRGKNEIGKILGYASDPKRTQKAAAAKFGNGVNVRKA
jgi:hypothetical protein